jgi:hypothetical protein
MIATNYASEKKVTKLNKNDQHIIKMNIRNGMKKIRVLLLNDFLNL